MCSLTIYCFSLQQNYYIPPFMKLAVNTTLKRTLNYIESYSEENADQFFASAQKSIKRGKMLDFGNFW